MRSVRGKKKAPLLHRCLGYTLACLRQILHSKCRADDSPTLDNLTRPGEKNNFPFTQPRHLNGQRVRHVNGTTRERRADLGEQISLGREVVGREPH